MEVIYMLSMILSVLSIFLFVLLLLAPFRRRFAVKNWPLLSKALSFHAAYAVLFLCISFIHGISAGKQTGMLTGKLAWLFLLLLMILALPKKKFSRPAWLFLHRGLTVSVCLLVLLHIFHVMLA